MAAMVALSKSYCLVSEVGVGKEEEEYPVKTFEAKESHSVEFGLMLKMILKA